MQLWNPRCSPFLRIFFVFLFVAFFAILSATTGSETSTNSSQAFVPVLCYHHIGTGELPHGASANAIVHLSEFEAQMKFLYDEGYYTASQQELQDFIYLNEPLPEKTVVITFDDGYESNYIHAFPILKKYGLKATIFLIGDRIVEEEVPYDPYILSKLSHGQIREMVKSGLIEFGNHTYGAHELRGSQPALLVMSEDEIVEDFDKMQNIFDKIDIKGFPSIAYPYGKYNDTVINVAKETQYKLGYTINQGLVYQDSPPYALNRIVVLPKVTPVTLKTLLESDPSALPPISEKSIILTVGSITAYVNGQPVSLEAPPFIDDDKIMIPLRFLARETDAQIHWDGVSDKVNLETSDISMEFKLDETNVVNGRTMVPLRLLSENLGFEVKWHPDENTVEIIK